MFSAPEAIIDYYRINQQQLSFIALNKKAADAMVKTVDLAKLNLERIEIESVSMIRSLIRQDQELYKAKTVMLIFMTVEKTIDIETKNHNFIANGLIVHNSAARFSRIRDNIGKEFFRKVAETMKKEFFNLENLKGIILGGPGPAKEDFLKEGQLITAVEEKIIGVKDIGYADEHGIDLLVEGSGDLLAEQEITHEKKILERFFNMLGKEKDKTAYKEKPVEKALDYGAVDILLLSKKLKKSDLKKFEKKAIDTSVKVELISVETEEGQQFWNLSGIGAMLRFKI